MSYRPNNPGGRGRYLPPSSNATVYSNAQPPPPPVDAPPVQSNAHQATFPPRHARFPGPAGVNNVDMLQTPNMFQAPPPSMFSQPPSGFTQPPPVDFTLQPHQQFSRLPQPSGVPPQRAPNIPPPNIHSVPPPLPTNFQKPPPNVAFQNQYNMNESYSGTFNFQNNQRMAAPPTAPSNDPQPIPYHMTPDPSPNQHQQWARTPLHFNPSVPPFMPPNQSCGIWNPAGITKQEQQTNVNFKKQDLDKKYNTDDEILDNNQKGKILIESWLQKIGKKKRLPKETSKEVELKSPMQLFEYINHLQDLSQQLKHISSEVNNLDCLLSVSDNSSWQCNCTNIEEMKTKWSSSKFLLEDNLVQQMETKLKKIRLKRGTLKRARKARFEEKQRREYNIQEKHAAIDSWQEAIRKEIKDEKLRKERKESADRTLSQVTKEIQDANRLVETMTALEKLRLIRRDAAQKRGDAVLGESRQSFQQKISDMTRLMKAQLEVYKEKEAKLKEVIKSEQEEKNKKEKEIQEQKDQEKQSKEDEELRSMLFPEDQIEAPSPLYPYYQFYKQAERSLPSLIQIRHEWDCFVVPEGTPGATAVPSGWVLPSSPSSSAWASALV